MNLTERIESFTTLGKILRDALGGKTTEYTGQLGHLIETQQLKNPWFTPDNVRMAISSIATELTQENLNKWTCSYPQLNSDYPPLRVAVVMAGNIPLVGFHDFLSVLLTGNEIIAKLSSKDPDLIVLLRDILCHINHGFIRKIRFEAGVLSGFDAVIATGSDNTSRYFNHYFGKYPNIIRKNRNSIAILDGQETDKELEALGTDIFSYFGLGCRSVSKIYVPNGYDFSRLTENWKNFSGIISHSKYANNYDFNKAVFLVNKERFIDNGFILFKEHYGLSSPVAVLYFDYYKPSDHINFITEDLNDKIQCIVGRSFISFGNAQSPALWDYADGVDTLGFLLKKNIASIL